MFGFLKRLTKKALTFQQLQIVQFIAQQVVLSVENSAQLKGFEKKALALELTNQILKETGVVAPDTLIDALLESSVNSMKKVNEILEPRKSYKIDLSGRPQSGN